MSATRHFLLSLASPPLARRSWTTTVGTLLWTAVCGAAVFGVVACGASQQQRSSEHSTSGWSTPAVQSGAVVKDDHSRCEYRGRADREAVETAGPGALQPNVRRVYQIVGTGESMHKVLVCREIDTNLDGIKDIVRTYSEKGDSLHEEADTNYDNKIDIWTTFAVGRIGKEEIDSNFDGRPDIWKYYVAGHLSRIQRDTNGDGKPDQWEFYTNGKLERVGIDVDFDGHVDRWDRDQTMRLAEEAAEASQSQAQGAKSSPAASQGAAAEPRPASSGSSQPKKP